MPYKNKAAQAAQVRRYYAVNKEKIDAYRRKYRQDNLERGREYQRQYRLDNKEQYAAYIKQWLEKNRDKLREYGRQRYQEHKEAILASSKQYRIANKDRINKYRRERMRSDPQFRIMHRLRGRAYELLCGKDKSASTLQLLGCSKQEFMWHLESQFVEGMSWDNRNQWHLDHIVPCAAFDLEKAEDQQKCFHYTNFQPLWAHANLKKGSVHDGRRWYRKDNKVAA